MTDQKELRYLITLARESGAVVTVEMDAAALEGEGREIIRQVQVLGLKGIGPHPMEPIGAAERLRAVLHRPEKTLYRWRCMPQGTSAPLSPEARGCGHVWSDALPTPLVCPGCCSDHTEIKRIAMPRASKANCK